MSYFGNRLGELLTSKKINQSEFSRLTGLSQAHISKLINGSQIWISPEDLEKICVGITTDRKEQAELVRAHLQDECNGPGSELIDIRITGKPLPMADALLQWKGDLPSKFAHHLAIISRNAEDKDLRIIIEGLANLFEKDQPALSTPKKPVSHRKQSGSKSSSRFETVEGPSASDEN